MVQKPRSHCKRWRTNALWEGAMRPKIFADMDWASPPAPTVRGHTVFQGRIVGYDSWAILLGVMD